MRVLVVGAGGREAAIAWACRRHGHDVRRRRRSRRRAGRPTSISSILGPEAALAAGIADDCAAARHPVLRADRRTRPARDVEALRPVARRPNSASPAPASPASTTPTDAVAWWRRRRRAGRGQARRTRRRQGRGRADGDRPRPTPRSRARGATGPFLLEERLHGPECSLMALCDGTTAVALPLAQDHKRIGEGDTGPNTGGMGAYAPAPVPYAADELAGHVRAAGARPLRRRRHAVRRRALRRADAHRRRSAAARVQLPLRRSGDAGRAAAARDRPRRRSRWPAPTARLARPAARRTVSRSATASSLTVVAAGAGLPDARRSPRRRRSPTAAPTRDRRRIRVRRRASTRDGAVAGGRVLAVTGARRRPRRGPAARLRPAGGRSSFDGMQVRRDIGWRALGAIVASRTPQAGVDIDEGTRAVVRDEGAPSRRTHDNGVLRGVGSFGGVFSAAAITALDDPVLVASTDGVGTKVELAARLGWSAASAWTSSTTASTTCSCRAPAAVLPRLHRRQRARRRPGRRGRRRHGRGLPRRPAAHCSAARPPRCPACTRRARSTSPARSSASPSATSCCRPADVGAGDVLDRRRLAAARTPTATRCCARCSSGCRWTPRPDGFDRPLGETLLEPHRSYLDVLTPALADRLVKALAHITGGGLPENLPRVLPDGVDAGDRARLVAGAAAVPARPRAGRRRCRPTSCTARSTWASAWSSICATDDLDGVQGAIAEPTWVIGELVAGPCRPSALTFRSRSTRGGRRR